MRDLKQDDLPLYLFASVISPQGYVLYVQYCCILYLLTVCFLMVVTMDYNEHSHTFLLHHRGPYHTMTWPIKAAGLAVYERETFVLHEVSVTE